TSVPVPPVGPPPAIGCLGCGFAGVGGVGVARSGFGCAGTGFFENEGTTGGGCVSGGGVTGSGVGAGGGVGVDGTMPTCRSPGAAATMFTLYTGGITDGDEFARKMSAAANATCNTAAAPNALPIGALVRAPAAVTT